MTRQQKQQSGLPVVGYNVWWRLTGVMVSRTELEQALTQAGFEDYLPDPPTPKKALRRALVAWITERAQTGAGHALASAGELDEDEAGSGKATRTLIRVVNKRRARYMTYALIAEEVDFTALGLAYGTQVRILLDKEDSTMICTTEAQGVIQAEQEARQIAGELLPHWGYYRDLYLSGDLSRMMKAIVTKLGGTPLRKEGGLYFVPAEAQPALDRLAALIETLTTDGKREPYLVALGVPDEQQAKRQLARAVHAGFMDELAHLASNLERFTEAPEGSVQEQTITARLQTYKTLRGKAKTYADLLQMQLESITDALDELERKARAVVLADDAGDQEDDAEEDAEARAA